VSAESRVTVAGVVPYSSPERMNQPAGGGAPRRVGEVMAGGATWLPDGRTILYGDGFQLKLVDRDGVPSYCPVPSASSRGRACRWRP
jgi:hypothetical protein